MTTVDLITAARLQRRQELHAQLERLMQGREPENGDQFAEWAKRVEMIRQELKILGER